MTSAKDTFLKTGEAPSAEGRGGLTNAQEKLGHLVQVQERGTTPSAPPPLEPIRPTEIPSQQEQRDRGPLQERPSAAAQGAVSTKPTAAQASVADDIFFSDDDPLVADDNSRLRVSDLPKVKKASLVDAILWLYAWWQRHRKKQQVIKS